MLVSISVVTSMFAKYKGDARTGSDKGSRARRTSAGRSSTSGTSKRRTTLRSKACATRFRASDSVFRIGRTVSKGKALAMRSKGVAVRVDLISGGVIGLFRKATRSTRGSNTRLLRPAASAVGCDSKASSRICKFSIPIPTLSGRFSLTLVKGGKA